MAKKRRRLWLLLPLLLAALLGYGVLSSLQLTVSTYTLEAAVAAPIRIVQLTDLHSAEFGENNDTLVALVAAQSPDLIAVTGDMINRDEEDVSVASALIARLAEIAPVCYGYGNHENAWEQIHGKALAPTLEGAGAVVLDNAYVDVEINGTPIRIGGYMGYYRQPHMFLRDETEKAAEITFCEDFEDTDRFKLLLNHIPTGWVDWGYIDQYPVDLVLSGHYHGGVVRIFDQGLYAPYVGAFPPYTKGLFAGDEAVCILSAGLGSEQSVPRMNNPPEIVVVDLVPADRAE